MRSALFLFIPLLVSSVAQAQSGWRYLGYSQGMAAADVVTRLDKLGYQHLHNCIERDSCTVLRRRGGNTELLSFRFCEANGALRDMWFSPHGGSLMTFADTLDMYRAQFQAEVIAIDTDRRTSLYADTDETLAVAMVVVYIANEKMLQEGWQIALSVEGMEDIRRFASLNTTVSFFGSCE